MILALCQFVASFASLVLGASHFRFLESKVYPDHVDIPQTMNAQRLCILDFTPQTDEAISVIKQLASQSRPPAALLVRNFNSLDTAMLEDFCADLKSKGYEYINDFPLVTGHQIILSKHPITDTSSTLHKGYQMTLYSIHLQVQDKPLILVTALGPGETNLFDHVNLEPLPGNNNKVIVVEGSGTAPHKIYITHSCAIEAAHILPLPSLTMTIIDLDI